MNCHTNVAGSNLAGSSIALIGHPNVGKSVLFQQLTGQHVTVSNYPGTTVEVTRGSIKAWQNTLLVDTPGVITFPPHSEDEQVTARVLVEGNLKAILQVGDAKNLRRTLLLTVQLAEMGLPMALALNMMDEASSRGVTVDERRLAADLDLPVVPTIAIKGVGISETLAALQHAHPAQLRLAYPEPVENTLRELEPLFPETPIAPRALALLWLSGDTVSEAWLRNHLDGGAYQRLLTLRESLEAALGEAPSIVIQRTRRDFVQAAAAESILQSGKHWNGFSAWLGRMTTHPVWGLGVLAVVLYALYWFVGILGAGTLVGLLEKNLFGEMINPWLTTQVRQLIPLPWLADFFVGEYGVWTMGITYALALILPIVSTFFLAFSVMEDSGYLPRLAALSNRFFQALGLNGKAVLPMVLGLGCVTMATLTTRVLESKRERLLVTLLLALAVPCSAQLGVVMGMLAGISLTATMIWSGVILLVLLAVGWLAAKLVPGERVSLMVELPPLRWPQFSNVLLKTLTRLEWYIKEVVPLFLLGAVLMYLLDLTGLLGWLVEAGEPLMVGWLGLPAEASAAFIMGFLRRDFGATGLFVMQSQGLLTPLQVVVSMVTITLFVPCIASVLMIAKERSWRTSISILVLIVPLAVFVGGLLNRALVFLGWGL